MTDQIQVFTQSSIRISGGPGVLYLDPIGIPGAPHDADFILITHDHGDHFSPEDIRKLAGPKTVLVVPEKMARQARSLTEEPGAVETVRPGQRRTLGALTFETVPAYNRVKPFHPKSAGWVGYLLEVDGRRIYVAGDTDLTPENRALRCDVALVPIGGTFTMDPKKAAELINAMAPAVAIPTHYGSIVGKPGDADVFEALVKPPTRVVRKLFL